MSVRPAACGLHRQASFYANQWPEGTNVAEDGDDLDDLESQVERKQLPEVVKARALRELRKLRRMSPVSPESAVGNRLKPSGASATAARRSHC